MEASKPSNVVHYLKMATKDDFRTVVKHYEKVIGKDLDEFGTKGPIVRIGDDDLAMALDHSAGPDQKQRAVDIRILAQETKRYYLNVVVSRRKDERARPFGVRACQRRPIPPLPPTRSAVPVYAPGAPARPARRRSGSVRSLATPLTLPPQVKENIRRCTSC